MTNKIKLIELPILSFRVPKERKDIVMLLVAKLVAAMREIAPEKTGELKSTILGHIEVIK